MITSSHSTKIAFPGGPLFGFTDDQTGPIGPIEIGKTGLKGWDIGLSGMCVGEQRRVIIPPQLAYGKEGIVDGDKVLVPPNSFIVVDVTLRGIQDRTLSFLERISSGQLDFGR